MTHLPVLCPSCTHCIGVATQRDKVFSDITEIVFVTCNATSFSIRSPVVKCPYFELDQSPTN